MAALPPLGVESDLGDSMPSRTRADNRTLGKAGGASAVNAAQGGDALRSPATAALKVQEKKVPAPGQARAGTASRGEHGRYDLR